MRRPLTGSLALALSALTPSSASQSLSTEAFSQLGKSALREGDLLFRAGRGWRSEVVRSASGSTLTHVGIVDVAADGRVYVIHADPPGHNQAGKVRRESLQKFADHEQATALVAFRPAFDEASLRQVVLNAERYSKMGIIFDDDFDLATDDALYCSELVWKAFAGAGVLLEPTQTQITFPGMSGYYIMPEDVIAMIPGRKL